MVRGVVSPLYDVTDVSNHYDDVLMLYSFSPTDCGPYGPLGMVDKSIGDSQITASSVYNDYHPENARLNGNSHWEGYGGREPYWIQVDFLMSVEISGIQIQGGSDDEEWTKTIEVKYGDTEQSLVSINDGNGNPMVTRTKCWYILI